MEIKREIVESRSEVSKDNLWLKSEDNKKKLLYYGIKGWTELTCKDSDIYEPSNPDDKPNSKIDLSKLTIDELLEFQRNLEKIKKKLPPEKYVKFLVYQYDNFFDLYRNSQSIYDYIKNNLSGKWNYEDNGQKVDIPEVVKVLDKGSILQLSPVNPDLYIEVINDNGINYYMLSILMTILYEGNTKYLYDYYYDIEVLDSNFYELQNNEVKNIGVVKASDYIRIIDKSTINGDNTEVTDGFRPRIKSNTIILDNKSDTLGPILEYYKYRSLNNVIQDKDKYIILQEYIDSTYSELITKKYKVISHKGFTLKDYYAISATNVEESTIERYKKSVLEFIGEANIKDLREYSETEYIQGGRLKKTWNIKSGDKFYLNSQPHIEFTVLADDINNEDLDKIVTLNSSLSYYNLNEPYYIHVEKYYSPYEDYKNPQNSKGFESAISGVRGKKYRAKESRDKLVALLDKLKDKIQYNGELIITIQN